MLKDQELDLPLSMTVDRSRAVTLNVGSTDNDVTPNFSIEHSEKDQESIDGNEGKGSLHEVSVHTENRVRETPTHSNQNSYIQA